MCLPSNPINMFVREMGPIGERSSASPPCAPGRVSFCVLEPPWLGAGEGEHHILRQVTEPANKTSEAQMISSLLSAVLCCLSRFCGVVVTVEILELPPCSSPWPGAQASLKLTTSCLQPGRPAAMLGGGRDRRAYPRCTAKGLDTERSHSTLGADPNLQPTQGCRTRLAAPESSPLDSKTPTL